MSLIIDFIIIAAAVAAIYLGIVRGFIKSVMHFVSLILALIAVVVFTGPVSEWVNERFVGERVSEITEDSLSGIVDAGVEKLQLEKVFEDRPDALLNVTERFSVDIDDLVSYYSDFLTDLAESAAIDELAAKLADPTAAALSTVAAAIVIFIVALLALKLITFILDLIFRLPVLNKLNTFLGFLFGIGSALITAWIISNMATGLIFALESINGDIFNHSVIDGSVILRFFYNNSLILFNLS